MYLHVHIWQMLLSSAIYIAFNVYMSSAHAFPGTRTSDFGVTSTCPQFFILFIDNNK